MQGGSTDKLETPGGALGTTPRHRRSRPGDLSTTPAVVSPPHFESISIPRCRGVAQTSRGALGATPPPSRSHRPDFPGEVLDHPPGSKTSAADLSTTPGVVSPPRFESISNPRCRGVARTSWRHRGSTGNDTPPQEESTRRLLRTSGRPPPPGEAEIN